jgi:hypothetical protein
MKYGFIVLVGVLTMAVSCKRNGEPYPRICTPKEDFNMKDTIKLSNCSERYTKQRWVMPDGSTSLASDVYFIPSAPITYTFKLYVTDEDFVQEYEAVRQITVAP